MSHKQNNNIKSSVFQRFFKVSVQICIVMVAVLFSALVVFLIFFQPSPVVSVPNTVGKNFVDATVLLQEKNLYSFVTLQYTDDPLDKGIVIKQDIAAGTAIRAKRIINLTVSRGALIAEMPDYRDLRYDEAVQSINAQFSGVDALLKITGVQKIFQDTESRIILAQKPAPGTKITSKNTGVSFVISRGNASFTSVMPDITGLYFYEIYEMMKDVDINFEFYISERDITLSTEKISERNAGLIIGQDPAAGKIITGSNVRFRIGIQPTNTTDSAKDEPSVAVGILQISLPSYQTPRKLVIRKKDNAASNISEMLTILTRGTVVSIPYFIVEGVMYEADVDGSIVWRYTVPTTTVAQ